MPPLQHLLVIPMITTVAPAVLFTLSLLALLAKVQPAKITHKPQRQNCHAVEEHVSQQRLNEICHSPVRFYTYAITPGTGKPSLHSAFPYPHKRRNRSAELSAQGLFLAHAAWRDLKLRLGNLPAGGHSGAEAGPLGVLRRRFWLNAPRAPPPSEDMNKLVQTL